MREQQAQLTQPPSVRRASLQASERNQRREPYVAPVTTTQVETDDVYPTRMPNSTLRYNGTPRIIPHPEQVQKIPRQPQEPKTTIGKRYTEEPATPKSGRLRGTFQAHPILYLGIGMLIALLLWVVGSW